MSDKATSGKEYGDAPWRDEAVLRELYVEQGMTVREIGDELGCSKATVSKRMDRYDIPAREGIPGSSERPWRDKEVLQELYEEQGLRHREIAEKLGCAHRTVGEWLDRHGIEKRGELWRIVQKNNPSRAWTNRELLYELHIQQELSPTEIAEELGCSLHTISRWLKKHDIPQKHYPTRSPETLHDEKVVRELYVKRGMTLYEIADEVGCAQKTVWNWLMRHGIETRAIEGENHPRWKGGVARDYGPTWPPQREAAIHRDGGQCRMCSMSREEHRESYGTDLHVHHIQEFASFDDAAVANKLENLATLCCACHGEVRRIAPLLPDVR